MGRCQLVHQKHHLPTYHLEQIGMAAQWAADNKCRTHTQRHRRFFHLYSQPVHWSIQDQKTNLLDGSDRCPTPFAQQPATPRQLVHPDGLAFQCLPVFGSLSGVLDVAHVDEAGRFIIGPAAGFFIALAGCFKFFFGFSFFSDSFLGSAGGWFSSAALLAFFSASLSARHEPQKCLFFLFLSLLELLLHQKGLKPSCKGTLFTGTGTASILVATGEEGALEEGQRRTVLAKPEGDSGWPEQAGKMQALAKHVVEAPLAACRTVHEVEQRRSHPCASFQHCPSSFLRALRAACQAVGWWMRSWNSVHALVQKLHAVVCGQGSSFLIVTKRSLLSFIIKGFRTRR